MFLSYNPTLSKFRTYLIPLLPLIYTFHSRSLKPTIFGKFIKKHQYIAYSIIGPTLAFLFLISTEKQIFSTQFFLHQSQIIIRNLALIFNSLPKSATSFMIGASPLLPLILAIYLFSLFGTQILRLLRGLIPIKDLKHQAKPPKAKYSQESATTLMSLSSQFYIKLCLVLVILIFSTSPALANEKQDPGSYLFRWTTPSTTSGEISKDRFPDHPNSVESNTSTSSKNPTLIAPFSFTVSDLSIDFGNLTDSHTFTQQNTLAVSSPLSGNYTVTASQDHPLKLLTSSTAILATTCNTSCSQSIAGVWTDPEKYGFGYNLSGQNTPKDFKNTTYFRPFPSYGSDPSQIVMSSTNTRQSRTSTVTYKLNISPTQSAGIYQNTIYFVAIPGY